MSNATRTRPHTVSAETRHNYAQRHADAGIPIDVLAELLDHRSYSVTRRDAVDAVTALTFDRHGNRIWRDAHALLEYERTRHAIGEVAVPYGTCTEPTNVKAGVGACPVRYRCAGCDHFRTNIAFLPDMPGIPRRPAAHPRTARRHHRRDRRVGPSRRHPQHRGDHPDPTADPPHQR